MIKFIKFGDLSVEEQIINLLSKDAKKGIIHKSIIVSDKDIKALKADLGIRYDEMVLIGPHGKVKLISEDNSND